MSQQPPLDRWSTPPAGQCGSRAPAQAFLSCCTCLHRIRIADGYRAGETRLFSTTGCARRRETIDCSGSGAQAQAQAQAQVLSLVQAIMLTSSYSRRAKVKML
jgi:hypothetical protein